MKHAGRQVFVTGMGAVSCLGTGVLQFWTSLLEGRCGLRPIDRFDLEGSPYVTGGQVAGMEPAPFERSGVSLGAQFAAAAAREAVGGLPADARGRLAVVLSTNFGPSDVLETLMDGAFRPPQSAAGVRRLADGPFAWDADHVAEQVGAGGERVNISLSCSSGNAALAHALDLVRCGHTDVALAGGYESIQKVTWAGLACMRVMAVEKEAGGPKVRPFDLHRAGTIFSEGAGAVLLESADHARARGAEPLAVVAGAGSNNNAFHMTHADKDGRATAEAILMALADAGISPDAVDHVNAHGTGTKLNDAIEARSLETVFGERVRRMPVNSIKGGLGHAMGAASSLEAIVCVLTLREGLIPPTVNYETPDPECNLDVVAGGPRKADVRTVVNNSAGIGGCNATVVFTKAN